MAIPLFNDFGAKSLEKAFKDIQLGNSSKCGGGYRKNRKENRAKETLLLIPAHLRDSVMEAVLGLHWAVFCWRTEHLRILTVKDGECVFYWRPDGTINRTKTAQQLVLNERFDVRDRFDIACMYFLNESVQTLWKKIEASSEIENFEEADCNFVTRFWVRWMREGPRVPWLQAVKENLSLSRGLRTVTYLRCSSFFPFLEPKYRKMFLTTLNMAECDDFRFCLYAATKEEERKILKGCARAVLILYLDWPLRSFFLEIAEKLWPFLDKDTFFNSLMFIWSYTNRRKDYDYLKLFMDFWNSSPNVLKELVKECPIMSKEIDSCLNEIRKRKRELSSNTNRKKWIRRDGKFMSIPWEQ